MKNKSQSKSDKNINVSLGSIDAICFDFDGVLTDNLVHIDQNGIELVSCSRSDGLAFDALNKLNFPVYIISTEINPVVTARAKKLKIQAIQGIYNKLETLVELADQKKYDLSRIFYVGNDLNDFQVMKACGYSACPSDSHELIKQIATKVLRSNGGKGVARELLEDVFSIDLIKLLFLNP